MNPNSKRFLLVIALPLLTANGFSQAAGVSRQFEVASVRLSAPDSPTQGQNLVTAFDQPTFKGGLFSANLPLFAYIVFAYKILDASQYQSIAAQLPDWAQSERFDIEARVEGDPNKDQVRLMMQTLLADRFKLASHTEARQQPVYELVLDKPGTLGPQLQPHPDNAPCPEKTVEAPTIVKPPPPYCGADGWPINGQWRANGQVHMRMADATMEEIASYLGGATGALGGIESRPIVNRTGLSGRFDMTIAFIKDQNSQPIDADSTGETFVEALRKQLGLKLVKQTGPASTLIIDHVERSSGN